MYVGGWFFIAKLFATIDVCGWVVSISRTLELAWPARVLETKTTHPHTSLERKSSGNKNHPPTHTSMDAKSLGRKNHPPTLIPGTNTIKRGLPQSSFRGGVELLGKKGGYSWVGRGSQRRVSLMIEVRCLFLDTWLIPWTILLVVK